MPRSASIKLGAKCEKCLYAIVVKLEKMWFYHVETPQQDVLVPSPSVYFPCPSLCHRSSSSSSLTWPAVRMILHSFPLFICPITLSTSISVILPLDLSTVLRSRILSDQFSTFSRCSIHIFLPSLPVYLWLYNYTSNLIPQIVHSPTTLGPSH